MIKNYFKLAWRNLVKNKIFSAINIIGLSVGMAACIIIMLFVSYEKSFDSFHKKNIVRLDEVQEFEGMAAPQNVALSMFPMGPTLQAEFPEIKNYCRIVVREKIPFTYKEKKIFAPRLVRTDSTFLQLFNFKLVRGNRNALDKDGSIVLSQKMATMLFGNEDPIGKTIARNWVDSTQFTVTGILEDIPQNSHLQFDMLSNFAAETKRNEANSWGGNWVVTYLELAANANVKGLEKKFPAYLKRHLGEGQKGYKLFLQPLKDVHAASSAITHDYHNFQKFDRRYTHVFSIIAFIVLAIGCVNFMNLSTARSAGRAKEVGVRKSIGAQRSHLIAQFLNESLLYAFIALLFAILLVKLFLPLINNISQRQLEFPVFTSPSLLLILIAGTVIAGIISGLYPAFYLSSFLPVKVLKGSISTGKNKSFIRNVLVVGQFSCAVFLIIATVFVVKQLNFMQTSEAGFNKEQVLVIPLNALTEKNYKVLKEELLKNPAVTDVAGSTQRLGNNLHQTGAVFHGGGPSRNLATSHVVVDESYLRLYKIPLAAGRGFNLADNRKGYIVNEMMAKELMKDTPGKGLEWLLGKEFALSSADSFGTIIGIAKNFNFNSFHDKIETLTISYSDQYGFADVSVRINGNNIPEALKYAESAWKKTNPDFPFEYSFLDEHFAEMYKADKQVSEVAGILATLAVIIACLGLFGLASFAAEKRIKEIGIRKILGASVKNLVLLLSKDFITLLLLANLIAWPLAWYAMHKWLENFAYHISISWWIFLASGCIAILIALLTVSFQAIKAAVSNPVKNLRTE